MYCDSSIKDFMMLRCIRFRRLSLVFFICLMSLVWMLVSIGETDFDAPRPRNNVRLSGQQRDFLSNYKHLDEDNDEGTEFIPGMKNKHPVIIADRNDALFKEVPTVDKKRGFANLDEIWTLAGDWVKSREIYPPIAPDLGTVLHAMSTAKVIHADVGYKGTQLKLMLTLQGGQYVAFKPMRYSRDYIVSGSPYGGYDRHNAEIAAFHLDRILSFRRAPLVVGRIIDLQTEILPVATEKLKKTFFVNSENNTCFYGECYYCNKNEPACAKGSYMEGSVTLWIPNSWPLQKWKHPWSRTYKDGKKARWEYDQTYCQDVIQKVPYNGGPRLLDVVDTCIMDYIIGNADRHHYETFQQDGNEGMLLNMDNAKSFGNPFHDERSILAPLYQCCKVRTSTWQKLVSETNGKLSELMRQALAQDPINPVINELHYEAMDRRLRGVMSEMTKCFEKNGRSRVLVDSFTFGR
ncbi:glycosaminoglycan xylosylkinase-like [Ptychodera flava]|uniref:glycosaminoglycan xylosylkinase-like n=1 Tax=Ptychodera flava TaxID=63121 RepID=UPI003969FCD9